MCCACGDGCQHCFLFGPVLCADCGNGTGKILWNGKFFTVVGILHAEINTLAHHRLCFYLHGKPVYLCRVYRIGTMQRKTALSFRRNTDGLLSALCAVSVKRKVQTGSGLRRP